MKHVVVLGGSGFVGSAIVHRLSAAGHAVRVLSRRRERAKHLILLPNVQVFEGDIRDDVVLGAILRGADAVINLIGVLHDQADGGFDALHAELPGRLVALCRSRQVPRLLHMSALQVSADAPSAYLRSKAAGEAQVLAAQDLQVTLFRPSVIFGRGDSFLSLFANLVRLLPAVVLAKPDARFQPVWVEDVAQAFLLSLDDVATHGQIYELGGPRVYTLRQLIEFVMFVLDKRRVILGLNDKLSYLQAWAMEKLPVKLMTRDNLASMQVDSVCSGPFPAVFDFQPTALEVVAPGYLSDQNLQTSYQQFRSKAGR